ncbi:MAG: DNA polymerase III subunit alpha, partial [Rhizobacter sp.]|nr:DNA polymerase III subunit alpha [Chlorobiales bacterium]
AGARKFVSDYKDIFGEDFYIELERHHAPNDELVNRKLIELAKAFDVKLIATNDVHYLNRKDAPLQEVMLAMKSKHTLSNPKRMKLPTDEFYLKSPDEMSALFDDSNHELRNTLEVAAKCEFQLVSEEPLLPAFPLPKDFTSENEYLRHITLEGVTEKYGDIESQGEFGKKVRDRIEYELGIITSMGFSSYFLIVSDLIAASRRMGYSVGPGRGSAAGSIVAYLTDITRVEPLKYDLLFERFLNPERVSMPDIDIDFTPVGKQKVLDYTIEKYGEQSVAKVIAIGTLGAKAVLKDVARVLEIPLDVVNRITKLVPSKPVGITLAQAINGDEKKGVEPVKELKALLKDNDPQLRKLIEYALALEGRARNVSMHAGGVIITNGAVDELVPLYISNKTETEERRYADEDESSESDELPKSKSDKPKSDKQVVTQYDKDWIEKAGLLKIDYLGLETLAVVDETLRLIERRHKLKIELEKLAFDDKKTFKIFQEGKMSGIFQFESSGMQSYMMQLRPTCLEDIIAMSALYRPGPMDFIPTYIDRKHGRETVEYPHDMLKPILETTYGIPVYQEQVMQMGQVMGGYTLGGADLLRRAMSKKKVSEMATHRALFQQGAEKQNISKEKADEVFDMMEKFAGYGFNKSHSAAYGVLAYWTAYLKANYTAEFMCAILNSEAGDAERVKVLTDEAKGFGLKILPPDVNKSDFLFTVEDLPKSKSSANASIGSVNSLLAIRFGLGAIKNVSGAGKEIVAAMKRRVKLKNSVNAFKNIFDFCSSVDLRAVNKKAMESLIEAGAMDSFGIHRAMLVANIEKAVDYGQQRNKSATTGQEGFFTDEATMGDSVDYPDLQKAEAWPDAERLKREKALLGFYLSHHPLDAFRRDYEAFTTIKLSERNAEPKRLYKIIGALVETKKHLDKKGNTMMFGVIEDFEGKADFTLFASVYEKFEREMIKDAVVMFIAEAETREGLLKLLVSEVVPIRKVRERNIRRVVLRLDASDESELEKVVAVKAICEKNRGETSLDFEVSVLQEGNPKTLRLFARSILIDSSNEVLDELASVVGEDSLKISG